MEVQVLIDSGNSLDHCGAITQQCADQLGLTLQPLDLEINTADKNHTMRPCGQVEDLHIWFPGQREATLLKSVLVLPDLNGDVNLGYKFLKENRGNLSFGNKEGRPVLQLPGQDKEGNAPILLQMSEDAGRMAAITVLGAKIIAGIPIKIEKPLLIEAGTFRRVPMVFTGLPKSVDLYVPRQYIGSSHTVEGVYKCTRWAKHKATFQLGFINPGEQDETLTPGLQGFYVEACVDQKVDYPQRGKRIAPTGHIRQMQDAALSPTRQAEIIGELKIHQNEYLAQHPGLKGKTLGLVHKYADVFTPKSEGRVGETDLLELELKMAPGPAIRQKPRPLNPTMKASLDEQIGEWLRNGVITESVSEYSSPLVPVKKKDGTVRWCVDFRRVNDRIIADSFPIPHIEELVQKAAGKKVYS